MALSLMTTIFFIEESQSKVLLYEDDNPNNFICVAPKKKENDK